MQVDQELRAPNQDYPQRRFRISKIVSQRAIDKSFVCLAQPQCWGHYNFEIALKVSLKQNIQVQEIEILKALMDYQNSCEEINIPSNIVKILDFFEYQNEYFITVMEKADSDLFQHLSRNQKLLSVPEKLQLCLDISYPLFYINSKGLVYLDIRPENYFKVRNNFKLIDYGLVRNGYNLTKEKLNQTFPAPETLDGQFNVAEKVHVWQLACLFYEIFSSKTLFKGQNQKMLQGNISDFKKNQNDIYTQIKMMNSETQFKQLMISMLDPNPDKRVGLQQIITTLQQLLNPNILLIQTLQKQDPNHKKQQLQQYLEEQILETLNQQDAKIEFLIENGRSYKQKFKHAVRKLKINHSNIRASSNNLQKQQENQIQQINVVEQKLGQESKGLLEKSNMEQEKKLQNLQSEISKLMQNNKECLQAYDRKFEQQILLIKSEFNSTVEQFQKQFESFTKFCIFCSLLQSLFYSAFTSNLFKKKKMQIQGWDIMNIQPSISNIKVLT